MVNIPQVKCWTNSTLTFKLKFCWNVSALSCSKSKKKFSQCVFVIFSEYFIGNSER